MCDTQTAARQLVHIRGPACCNSLASAAGCFPHQAEARAHEFPGKRTVFFSTRVHPGETPASHLMNGMLLFLLQRDDPRAAALRRAFVFKVVPIVNPDGVSLGHCRVDTLGQNLNGVLLISCTSQSDASYWSFVHF
jgi:murein tripeptide amidase MpaA